MHWNIKQYSWLSTCNFCNMNTYNANDIDRYTLRFFYLLFLLYPISLCQNCPWLPLQLLCLLFSCGPYAHTSEITNENIFRSKRQQQLLQHVCCYIWLYEVCHPPVQIKKNYKIVRPTSMLHLTVWGVPPTRTDEKKNTYTYFYITSDCMRCAIPQFRWKKKSYK